MNLSRRETILLFMAALAIVFLLAWQVLFRPLLVSISQVEARLDQSEQQVKTLEKIRLNAQLEVRDFELLPREAQLNLILNFLDQKFRWFGLELVSLKQSFTDHQLAVALTGRGTNYQVNGLLNSLVQLKTLLVIDEAKISQDGQKVILELKLLSGYL